jgi:flagellar hook assembly protein FlgD
LKTVNPRGIQGRIDMGVYENQNVVGSGEILIPNIATLYQNYPNPFNPTTTISFDVTQTLSFVTLEIYNLKGQKVKILVNKTLESGNHTVIWNGTDNNNKSISSGIYFYKMKPDNFEKTKK